MRQQAVAFLPCAHVITIIWKCFVHCVHSGFGPLLATRLIEAVADHGLHEAVQERFASLSVSRSE